jgi:hypothetical protein
MIRASFFALVVVAAAACGGKSSPPSTPPMTDDTGTNAGSDTTTTETGTPTGTGTDETMPAGDKVCCESFGYGAQMAQCCQTYAWTTADECKVAPGFVGGGKQVVASDKCGS